MTPPEVIDVLRALFEDLAAGRVTLRQDVPDERNRGFPVTDELLAPGAVSIKDEDYVDILASPVAAEVVQKRQVVQHDSASCYPDDPDFHEMRAEYGDLAAQIVTPVIMDDRVVGIVSVHELGSARQWRPDEIATCSNAAARIAKLLATQ